MARDDNVIENDVVKISPDLTGFREKLDAELKKAVAKVSATVKIKLVADAAGFNDSAKTALAKQAALKSAPTYKVRLVADATGFNNNAREALASQALLKNAPTYKVKLVADTRGLKGVSIPGTAGTSKSTVRSAGQDDERSVNTTFKRIEGSSLVLADTISRNLHAGLQKAFLFDAKDSESLLASTQREVASRIAAVEREAQAVKRAAQDEAAAQAKLARAAQEASRIFEREAAQRARAAEQESERTSKAWSAIRKGPQLIALGQSGIQPMNLLRAAVLALSPALFAMGASALQASTSIAALGAAGYGAGLGIAALTISFKGLTTVLALRKSVLAEQAQNAANAGTAADTLTAAIDSQRDAQDALTAAQRDERKALADVHDARLQAAKDLVNLKQKVRDLQNQEKSDSLSVAEAKDAQAVVSRNYFATGLEKARATQDVNDAITRASDTRLDLKTNTGDLKTAVKKGVEGSPTVVDAKDRASDATRTRKRAQTTLKRATTATKKAGSGATVSSAQANLDKELKEHSQALRDLYGWIDKNADKFKVLRNRIEQATLPGFTTFLDDITQKGHIKGSIVDIVTDGIAGMGAQISKTAKKAGKFFSSKYFKNAAKTLNGVTERSFGSIGDSAVKLLKPLTQIFVAASPLLEKFADGFGKFADWFATVIDKASKSGALQKWFRDAGTEAGKWLDIAKNLITFVGNLFKLSLPTGDSLVQRFSDFTGQLASWSGRDSGQKQIKQFFDFFKDLNYGDVAKIVGSAVQFFAAYRIAALVKASPMALLFSAFATFAASNPALTAEAMSTMAAAIQNIVKAIVDHPKSAGTLLAILAAAKAAKALDIGIKLPGVDNLKSYLTGKFKFFEKLTGEQKTAVMTVHAGTVYVNGGVAGDTGVNGKPSGKKDAAGNYVDTTGKVIDPSKPVGTDPKTGKPVYINDKGKVSVGKPSKTLVERFNKSGAGVGTALIASLAADAAISQIPAKAGSTGDALKAAAQGAISGGLTGAALAGPIGAFVGAGVGAIIAGGAVGGYMYNGDTGYKDKFTGPQKKEASTYTTLFQNLGNNSSVLGNGTDLTAPDNYKPLQDYITARKESVTALVDSTKKTKGASEATKVNKTETQKSVDTLSKLLQQLGWNKTAADKYATEVYGLAGQLSGAKTATDYLGNSMDNTRGKIDNVNVRTGVLHDTLKNATIGDHVIAISTKGYAEVKKQLDMLYAIQHVLYNPAYSNSAAGADTVSSQNQYLDPKTGLPKTYMKAAGGHIIGPGTATSDSIPARLSNGEYVMPTKAVQHYGVGVMDAMRSRQIPTDYAAGGAVGDIPMTVNLPVKGFTLPTPDRTGNTGSSVGASDISGLSSADRVANAQVILDVGTSLKATVKEKLAAIETAWVESKLVNLSGGDRDSVGLFQQRPSQGWGTVKQLMNPRIAAAKFYHKLFKVWSDERTPGLNAQAVQISGYPLRYDEAQGIAQGFINQATGGFGGATGSKKNLIEFGHWLQSQGYQVSENPLFGGVTPGAHVKGSTHYTGDAIDVNHGAGTSKREQAWLTNVLADAHAAGLRTIFMAPGHYNHLHVDDKASASIGRTTGDRDGVNFRAYDTGGDLPPGYTLAYNGTGKTETVRTHKQEQALTAPAAVRLDRRDIALLAQHLGMVLNGQTIQMDGRKVAEATTRYNYLPAGV